jgi:hypothetical protein
MRRKITLAQAFAWSFGSMLIAFIAAPNIVAVLHLAASDQMKVFIVVWLGVKGVSLGLIREWQVRRSEGHG